MSGIGRKKAERLVLELKDKILAERSHGVTFVLTSHIMSEVEDLSRDRDI